MSITSRAETLPSLWTIACTALAIPVGLLVFFAVARPWYAHDILESAARAQSDAQVAAWFRQADLSAICRGADPELTDLRSAFVDAGICGERTALDLSLWLSCAALGVTVAYLVAIQTLRWRSRGLGAPLVTSYRVAWAITPPAAIAKVVAETVLLTFACYEATALASQMYMPKLIGLVAIGGIGALVASLQAIRLRIPLETREGFVTALSRAEAPNLWQLVDNAAQFAQTSAPDHLLVAESTSFYVTEFDVVHDGGRATGRTLVLSRPLLAEMTSDELLAVIGHELAHFAGGDTVLTRELYPRWARVQTMTAGLSTSLAGFAPLQLLRFYGAAFLPLLSAQSRLRELAADAAGARLASPHALAAALVRIHVLDQAYSARWAEVNAAMGGLGNRVALVQTALGEPLRETAVKRLFPDPGFWPRLFALAKPHPLDSHPPLASRLEALGVQMDAAAAQLLLDEAIPEDDRASTLIVAAAEKVAKTASELDRRVTELIEAPTLADELRLANVDTAEGRALLEAHFPPLEWPVDERRLLATVGGVAAGGLLSLVAALAFWDDGGVVLLVAAAGMWAWAMVLWTRHRGSRLRLECGQLSYSGWAQPLTFKEVVRYSRAVRFGRTVLTLHLRTPSAPRERMALLRSRQMLVDVPLGFIAEAPAAADAVQRNLLRRV